MHIDITAQSQLISNLMNPAAYAHPAFDIQHIETHISHVLLVGDFAYKIKKPINLGFLDYSSLKRRKFFCEEELRLNRRLAAELYLQVTPISGTLAKPLMGGAEPALEYAVKMRRFAPDALLNAENINRNVIDQIAERIAVFHQHIPTAPPELDVGEPEQVAQPMRENFQHIRNTLKEAREQARLDPLETWTEQTFQQLRATLGQRKAKAHIRECHGDLHLGNIALIEQQAVIFDGIEFNPHLRWIDTFSEAAFLFMDLRQAKLPALAWRFLNRYLQLTGDYAALPLLDFYQVYRALVRAKVTAIRLAQAQLSATQCDKARRQYERYLATAENCTRPRQPALLITHGLSGSGKTYVSGQLLEQLALIRLRSDIERKRLFGLAENERSGSAAGAGIYDSETSARTYRHLREQSRLILQAGYSVVVDAAFLKQAQRQAFAQLAETLSLPFIILDLVAPEAELRRRVAQRHAAGADASEADLSVLQRQTTQRQDLSAAERARAIAMDSSHPLPLAQIQRGMRSAREEALI